MVGFAGVRVMFQILVISLWTAFKDNKQSRKVEKLKPSQNKKKEKQTHESPFFT